MEITRSLIIKKEVTNYFSKGNDLAMPMRYFNILSYTFR